MASRPRTLSQYPWVTVRIACRLCTRFGRYRLARLAVRYGAEMPLPRILADMAHDCAGRNDRARAGEPRCGVMFVDLERSALAADEPVLVPERRRATHESPPPRNGRLADWPWPRVVLTCTACKRHDIYRRHDLLAAMPRDALLPDVLHNLVGGCPNRRAPRLGGQCDTARLLPE